MNKIIIKGLIDEDFLQYKYPSMVILFPNCTFKCNKENGKQVCQNDALALSPSIEININTIVDRYINNDITKSMCFGGLEPFDSWNDLIELIKAFRNISNDDIVIYTGYNKNEITIQIKELQKYSNIIIKYGRFIPNCNKHYDEELGIYLSSDNQYAERIS